jgi:hypothetical protein
MFLIQRKAHPAAMETFVPRFPAHGNQKFPQGFLDGFLAAPYLPTF